MVETRWGGWGWGLGGGGDGGSQWFSLFSSLCACAYEPVQVPCAHASLPPSLPLPLPLPVPLPLSSFYIYNYIMNYLSPFSLLFFLCRLPLALLLTTELFLTVGDSLFTNARDLEACHSKNSPDPSPISPCRHPNPPLSSFANPL